MLKLDSQFPQKQAQLLVVLYTPRKVHLPLLFVFLTPQQQQFWSSFWLFSFDVSHPLAFWFGFSFWWPFFSSFACAASSLGAWCGLINFPQYKYSIIWWISLDFQAKI